MKSRSTWLAALPLALGSCMAPMGAWPETAGPASTYGAPATATPAGRASGGEVPAAQAPSGSALQPAGDYPLYSRDGGVVESREPGSVTEGKPSHDVQPTASGRMYILELYQDAIDARDALQLEVTALNSALQRAQTEIDGLQKRVADAEAAAAERTSDVERLTAENSELAARMVTAQIRRLEAEKVLLESKLEWYRQSNEAAGGAPPRKSKRTMSKPATPEPGMSEPERSTTSGTAPGTAVEPPAATDGVRR